MMDFFSSLATGGNAGYNRAGGRVGGGGPTNWKTALKVISYQHGMDHWGIHTPEKGNKVLLPSEVLATVINWSVPLPMTFRIQPHLRNKEFLVGVDEFTAPSEHIVVPKWLFDQMDIKETHIAEISLVPALPKCAKLQIQAHEMRFMEMQDFRGFLEINLRDFVVLTKGDTIQLKKQYGDKRPYNVDIKELWYAVGQGQSKKFIPTKSCCTLGCELNLDFLTALDYEEPEPELTKGQSKVSSSQKLEDRSEAWFGGGIRVDGKEAKYSKLKNDEDWNPRKHVLVDGVRKNFSGRVTDAFHGKGVKF
jgi:hypothetical protein